MIWESTFPCELIQTEIFIFSFKFVWLIYLVIIVIIIIIIIFNYRKPQTKKRFLQTMSGSFKHLIMSSDLILVIQEARMSVGPIYFKVMWKLCDVRMQQVKE